MRTHLPTSKFILIAVLVATLLCSTEIRALHYKWTIIENATLDKDTLKGRMSIFPYSSHLKNQTVLTFTIINPTKVTIKIFDVDGREVAYLLERNVPAGTFELLLETKFLKKGMYYCKFFTGERISMKKMIMVK